MLAELAAGDDIDGIAKSFIKRVGRIRISLDGIDMGGGCCSQWDSWLG